MPRHRSSSLGRVPAQPGRFATLLLCAAGTMFFLALGAVVLVLRGSDPLLFRAHSVMLPHALQTLGSAMLLGACGATLFASRFKHMLTTQTRQRHYTTLALLGAVTFGCAFLSLAAREWELMLDRTTLVTRAPAEVMGGGSRSQKTDDQSQQIEMKDEKEASRDGKAAENSPQADDIMRRADNDPATSTLIQNPKSKIQNLPPTLPQSEIRNPPPILYVTDARLDRRGTRLTLEGVTAPLPVGVSLDVHRVSRPEIAEWPGAVRGTLQFNAADVVALQPHGPRKNMVFASYYAIAGATTFATVGLTLLCIVLLARHLLHRPVFRATGNVGILWAFLTVMWIACRAML